jgi:uncharacterized damage-inducible protein DinB
MKKNIYFASLSLLIVFAISCSKKAETASASASSPKEPLLHQLKTTHTEKEWFVPVKTALEGLTAAQAQWRDSSGNHSVGQLAYHLLFWNKRQLAKFNGQPEGEFSGNNEETFTDFDQAKWDQTVSSLDSVLTAFEKAVADADEDKLREWYPTIANISTHNAYHTGQIVFVRKLQKAWDAEKGVK